MNSTLEMVYDDFVAVDNKLFLPKKITVVSHDAYYMEMIAKKIRSERILNVDSLGTTYDGTIISDYILNKKYITGTGNVDLLDLTIQRMLLASQRIDNKSVFFSRKTLFYILLFILCITFCYRTSLSTRTFLIMQRKT